MSLISRAISNVSPKSLCPVSRLRIKPVIRTSERLYASTLRSYLCFRILPPQVEPSPGTIHSLLVVERKSPARKYRRRRGNGGAGKNGKGKSRKEKLSRGASLRGQGS